MRKSIHSVKKLEKHHKFHAKKAILGDTNHIFMSQLANLDCIMFQNPFYQISKHQNEKIRHEKYENTFFSTFQLRFHDFQNIQHDGIKINANNENNWHKRLNSDPVLKYRSKIYFEFQHLSTRTTKRKAFVIWNYKIRGKLKQNATFHD